MFDDFDLTIQSDELVNNEDWNSLMDEGVWDDEEPDLDQMYADWLAEGGEKLFST